MDSADFLEILRNVDNGNFDVSDYEATFLESNLERAEQYGDRIRFSQRQQDFILAMEQKYLRRLT